MNNTFFDELKSIKSKLAKEEKSSRKIEEKKDRENRLRNEFENYMCKNGIKKN